jgi:tRNA pseudouridine38-40 synthase
LAAQPRLFDDRAAPEGPLVRVKLVVAYDGRPFRGFAETPGVATVAGTLRVALERTLGHAVEHTGAGRTDAGVHAAAARLDLARLQRSANRQCEPAIVVRSAEVVGEDFDARFSARWRRYRYTVLNAPVANPFLTSTAWHVAPALDLGGLRLAADPLVGEHDFSSFCRRPKGLPGERPVSLARRVLRAHWDDAGDGRLVFEIQANAFCHQMVRSIVGTLVDVGLGKRRAGDMLAILRARDRAAAGPVAPAHGLCLVEVGY